MRKRRLENLVPRAVSLGYTTNMAEFFKGIQKLLEGTRTTIWEAPPRRRLESIAWKVFHKGKVSFEEGERIEFDVSARSIAEAYRGMSLANKERNYGLSEQEILYLLEDSAIIAAITAKYEELNPGVEPKLAEIEGGDEALMLKKALTLGPQLRREWAMKLKAQAGSPYEQVAGDIPPIIDAIASSRGITIDRA